MRGGHGRRDRAVVGKVRIVRRVVERERRSQVRLPSRAESWWRRTSCRRQRRGRRGIRPRRRRDGALREGDTLARGVARAQGRAGLGGGTQRREGVLPLGRHLCECCVSAKVARLMREEGRDDAVEKAVGPVSRARPARLQPSWRQLLPRGQPRRRRAAGAPLARQPSDPGLPMATTIDKCLLVRTPSGSFLTSWAYAGRATVAAPG
jgi:hypothetical protein